MNERFGKTLVAQVLKGSRNKRVVQFGFENLSTYGLMKKKSEKEIVALIDFLVAEGFVNLTNGQYPVLMLGHKSLDIIKGNQKVYKKEQLKRTKIIEDNELFEELRVVRKQIASDEGIPPYIVFADSTLREMSEKCPVDKQAMLAIKGIAQTKYDRYGAQFLEVIQRYTEVSSMK